MARNFSKDIPLRSVAQACAGLKIAGANPGGWTKCKLERLSTDTLDMGQAKAKLVTKGAPLVTESLEEAVHAKCERRQPYPDILPGAKLAKPCAPKYKGATSTDAPSLRDGHSELVFISPENAANIGAEPGPNIRLCYRLKKPGALIAVNNPKESVEVGKRFAACVQGDNAKAEKCALDFVGARQETTSSRVKKSGATLKRRGAKNGEE